MKIHTLYPLVLWCSMLLLAQCSLHHQNGASIRTGQVVSGPGTLAKRNNYGLIVRFKNGDKQLFMQMEVLDDPIRFYDSFYHYNIGETVTLRFLPNNKVSIGSFLFSVVTLKEYQETTKEKKTSQPKSVTST